MGVGCPILTFCGLGGDRVSYFNLLTEKVGVVWFDEIFAVYCVVCSRRYCRVSHFNQLFEQVVIGCPILTY